jgi:hypothetical protein
MNNKRSNVWIDTPKGRLTVAAAARAFGIPAQRIKNRRHRGQPMDDLWV